MRKLALRLMQSCGGFALTRALSAGMARVLMYHNFSGVGYDDPNALNVDGIRAQFEYLRRHFNVVPLLQIAGQLASGSKLDPNMVALTIDDGRRNCHEFLFPLLKEFEFPATFFVVSSFIRGEDWIWTDKVLWLSEQPEPSHEMASTNLDDCFRWLNRMRPEDRNARIEAMAKSAGTAIPQVPPLEYAPCSWTELREMADSGLMEIGSHSATHAIFSSITEQESWQELSRSRAQIEEGMGRSVRCFCFPNGMPGDFRPSQVRQAQDAGYLCAVTAQFGMLRPGGDRYQIPRIGMTRKSSRAEIGKVLDGFAYYQGRFGVRWSREHSAPASTGD
jgi:peptidoglycan/xylan/chitin deacetylase (PgdA/CDA1 family)